MAAMRDVVSFFRYTREGASGSSESNLRSGPSRHRHGELAVGPVRKAFLNLGFNEDVHGRIVWDGLNARIAGMLGSFNIRGLRSPATLPNSTCLAPKGPLWWGDYEDTVRGLAGVGAAPPLHGVEDLPEDHRDLRRPGVLVQPWHRRHCGDDRGTEDLPLPDNVRRYYHAGTTHGGGMGGFKLGTPSSEPSSPREQSEPERETDRALYVALVEWVVRVRCRRRACIRASATDAGAGDIRRHGLAEYSERAEA